MPIDLAKAAPDLVPAAEAARISLAKNGLGGVRAAVYLVIDHSGSMRPYYRSGAVQTLTERILALSANLDDDGTVPVFPFDTRDHPCTEVTIGAHAGAVERIIQRLGPMGKTNYGAAIRAVTRHHNLTAPMTPALVVFQTDGNPDSRRDAEAALCDSARSALFWQFIGFGDSDFAFLHKLDTLAVPTKRVVDNAGFFSAGTDPSGMSEGHLYDMLTAEFPSWLRDARAAGIVR